MRKYILIFLILIFISGGFFLFFNKENKPVIKTETTGTPSASNINGAPTGESKSSANNIDPLTIAEMKKKSYPGSDLVIEKTYPPEAKFNRYLVSYFSDGLKLHGLLTEPIGQKPLNGWPVILFNHGYIPPASYSTENSYISFITPLASAGYIVFKPDYRGNGNSPGTPMQPYISPYYLTDSMNALASVMKYKDANPQEIGVFGHSMGGNITLHELVISKNIKAAEIIAGVVGNEKAILTWWNQRFANKSITGNDLDTWYVVEKIMRDHGTTDSNPGYWNSIDPTKNIADVTAPVEIQVGTADTSVPPIFSSSLRDALQNAGKTVGFYSYEGDNHNLSGNLDVALQRSVAFFDKYLK